MASQLDALAFDAHDPPRLAAFWAELLGRETAGDGVTLGPSADGGFRIRFLPTDDPKSGPNQMHPELTSAYPEQQQETVARALALGASHLDVGQLPEEGHVVLADPEGNEFCVIPAGNSFLAGCGFLGDLSADGTQEVGYFWSQTLGWPLVWDQDEETAIQAPEGGTKVAWGGPPVRPKTGKNRMHFDLTALGDQQAEVDRLVSLGATVVDSQGARVAMLDPDGNEFCLLGAGDTPSRPAGPAGHGVSAS